MEKGASEAVICPSLTVMTMLANVLISAVVGVPVSAPVALLKLAQEGLFAIVKLSVSPSASLAEGENA